MGPEAFDALVDRALDQIPDELARLVRNVVVLVEDEAPDDDPDLLGLYDGIALTERWGAPMMELPDRIFVFRNNLLDMCDSVEELEDRPLEEHVGVFETAHDQLRRALDAPGDDPA